MFRVRRDRVEDLERRVCELEHLMEKLRGVVVNGAAIYEAMEGGASLEEALLSIEKATGMGLKMDRGVEPGKAYVVCPDIINDDGSLRDGGVAVIKNLRGRAE